MAKGKSKKVDAGATRQFPIRAESKWQSIEIRAEDFAGCYQLFLDDTPNSFINLHDPMDLGFEYLETMRTLVESCDFELQQNLYLGGGACTFPRFISHKYPKSENLVFEIDETLSTLCREVFALPRAPKMRIRSCDALREIKVLASGSKKYQLILRDVFIQGQLPHESNTVGFFESCLPLLDSPALLLLNSIGRPGLAAVKEEHSHIVKVLQALNWKAESYLLAGISEHGVLKHKRTGNFVWALFRDLDLDYPGLSRELRRRFSATAIPMKILIGDELTDFLARKTKFSAL